MSKKILLIALLLNARLMKLNHPIQERRTFHLSKLCTPLTIRKIENMRTIAELPHPECKITLFQMGQKYIIKFEQGQLEQNYKISELDLTGGGVNEVFQIIDEEFLTTVIDRFKSMRTNFKEAYQRQQ